MTAASDNFLQARQILLDNRLDYDRAYAEFRAPILESFNWAHDWFDKFAMNNHRPALLVYGESGEPGRLTFAELSDRSSRIAGSLRARGVQRGDRLLVMLPNVVPLWETLLAAMKLGAIIVPATPQLTESDLRERIERAAIHHFIADDAGLEKLAAFPARNRINTADFDGLRSGEALAADGVTRAADPLLIYFTSGTTARPKGVVHTHQSYPVGHLSTLYWIGLRENDVHFNISTPGWAKHAWSSFFAPWNAGATVAAYDYRKFSIPRFYEILRAAKVTSLCAPPTVWRMLIAEEMKKPSPTLREAVSAGEPLNPEVIERVRAAWNITVRDGYGQTETTAQIANTPGQEVKLGAMGRPLPGYRVRLLDSAGKESTEGEIALALAPAPLGLMTGYHGDSERTALVTALGNYRTGDEAKRDGDGYYFYLSRADDVFKCADYRLSPFELESAVLEHPAVAEVAVVPSPDPIRLNVPKAFVVLRAGHVAGKEVAHDLFTFLRARLPPYARIRRIELVAELPKTISGKIRRAELRKREAEIRVRAAHDFEH